MGNMEIAWNIYGVIDMCIQILKELPEVEVQLMQKSSTLVKNYTTTLSLCSEHFKAIQLLLAA